MECVKSMSGGSFLSVRTQATVNAFASRSNSTCDKFFFKWPQVGSSGVNFFVQLLVPEEVYFYCPPVKDIGHMLIRLKAYHDVTAIF